jgi:hypothetical protein
VYILEKNSDGTFNQHKVLISLVFHKLNNKRKDIKGAGIAVIIKDYDGEYELISIDDRGCFGTAHEFGCDAEYIYNTILEYPEDIALTFGFTKYRIIEETDDGDLQKLVDAYNTIERLTQIENEHFTEWESMNKTQFKEWKSRNRREA